MARGGILWFRHMFIPQIFCVNAEVGVKLLDSKSCNLNSGLMQLIDQWLERTTILGGNYMKEGNVSLGTYHEDCYFYLSLSATLFVLITIKWTAFSAKCPSTIMFYSLRSRATEPAHHKLNLWIHEPKNFSSSNLALFKHFVHNEKTLKI